MASVVLSVRQLPFPGPRLVLEVPAERLLTELFAALATEYQLESAATSTALYLSGLPLDASSEVRDPAAFPIERVRAFPGATWAFVHAFAVSTEFELLVRELRPDASPASYEVRSREGDWSFLEPKVRFESPKALTAWAETDAAPPERRVQRLLGALEAIPDPPQFAALEPETRALLEDARYDATVSLHKQKDWPRLATLFSAWQRATFPGPGAPVPITPALVQRLLPEADAFSRYQRALEERPRQLPGWPENTSSLLVTLDAALSGAPTPESFAQLGKLLNIDAAQWLRRSAVFLAAHPEPDQVDRLLPKVAAFAGDLGVWLEYAFGHAAAGRSGRARAALRHVLDAEPAIPSELRRKVPRVLFALREYEEAESRLRAYLAEPWLPSVSRAVATFDLVRVLRERGKTAEADEVLQAEQRREAEERRAVGGTVVRDGPKVKPNDPCPCGSGKKAKKCHGAAGPPR